MHAGWPLEDVSGRWQRIPSASVKIIILAAPGQVTWATKEQHISRGTGGEATKPGGEERHIRLGGNHNRFIIFN